MKDIGKTFFKVLVGKKESEELEYEKNDLIITKEESNSRIICILTFIGLIEILLVGCLCVIPTFVNQDKVQFKDDVKECKFTLKN